MTTDIRHGNYADVLSHVRADCIITDPPYSEKTHVADRKRDNVIEYEHWDEQQCAKFATWCAVSAREWVVIFTDSNLHHAYQSALRCEDMLVWTVPWIKKNAVPRMLGDGPQQSCEWIVIARHRTMPRVRSSRPGYYLTHVDKDVGFLGAKPIALMRAIVRDYSCHGDLVCDPCVGSGTTAAACAELGRSFVGAEMDLGRYDLAVQRCTQVQQPLSASW